MAHRRREGRRILWTAAATVAAWIVAAAGGAGHAAGGVMLFQPLNDLPGGTVFAHAHAVSGDGNVVVGTASSSATGSAPVVWNSSVNPTPLTLPGAVTSGRVFGVSADGTTAVGGSTTQVTGVPLRWQSGQFTDLRSNTFMFGGVAYAASADGLVIVGQGLHNNPSVGPNPFEAFRWTTQQGMVGLGDLPGGVISSGALACSLDGAFVVGFSSSGFHPQPVHGVSDRTEAFLWSLASGTMMPLGDLAGGYFFSAGTAVSADGSVVAGNSITGPDDTVANARLHAFRWTQAGAMVDLGTLPGRSQSSAEGMSADGRVIVGHCDALDAFLWTAEGGMRSLKDVLIEGGVDMTGWSLWEANGISSDGQWVCGVGRNPFAQFQAFVARVPEPSGVAIAAGAATLLARRRVPPAGGRPRRKD